MKKAIILARVSTKEQEETGLSIEKIQIPEMTDYAKANDLDVIKTYQFQETGDRKIRKKFDEMVKFVRNNKEIQAIIVYRVDRLTRNFRDHVLMDTLRLDYDKEIHFVDDEMVITKNSFGKVIQDWDTKVYLAKQHINRCQEDAFNTLYSQLKSGDTYGKAPYGYINYTKEDVKKNPDLQRVEVDPFKAGIVKMIFDLYTSGADSYLSIAKKLYKQFPSEFPKLPVAKRRVESTIKNPYYYGERLYEGRLHPHKFATIITEEIFEIANEKRLGRNKIQDKKKKDNDRSIYGGFLICAECGSAFSPDQNRHAKKGRKVKSEYYYYCNNSKHKHNKKPLGTNDAKLNKQFGEIFKHLQIPKNELNWLVKSLRDSHEGKKQFNQEVILNYRQMIDKYQNRIEKAYEDKLDGSITQAQYDKFRSEWSNKKDEYKTKLDRIDKADTEYYITASYLLELASRSYELFIGSEPYQKRQLIGLVFQNLLIKDGNLHYDLVKPFDTIFKTNDSHGWGRIWNDARRRLIEHFILNNPLNYSIIN